MLLATIESYDSEDADKKEEVQDVEGLGELDQFLGL